MVLVNGVEGIGTGWSSSVPNFNPRDIIENLRRWLKKQEMKEMTPWFAGFTGGIAKSREEGKWEVTGNIRNLGEGKAEITELPVKRWTQDYREILEENLPKGEKKREGPKLLEDYQEYHSEKSVHFELSLSSEGQLHADKDNLEKVFKLRSSISMNNMMLFDSDGKIKKYDTPKDILQDFAQVRLKMYETRKAYFLARLTRECEVLSAKARFVKLVIEGRIVIRKRKIADLAQDLRKHGFKALRDLQGEQSEEKEAEAEEEEDSSGQEEDAADVTKTAVRDFEYLVGMPISTLTAEKVAKLMQEHELKARELRELQKKKPADLWLEDLQALEVALDERDAAACDAEEKEKAKIQKAKAKNAKVTKGLKRSASGPPDRAGREEGKPKAKAKARSQSAGRRGLKRAAGME